MISLALTGCGKEENPAQSTSTETQKTSEVGSETKVVEEGFQFDSRLNEVGKEPISKEKVTLTILIRQYANVEDYDTNLFTKKLEEAANVDLEFIEVPADQLVEKVRLMAAAGGDDLPDIIIHSLQEDIVSELARDEMIIPLDDYYENCSVYFKEGFEKVFDAKGLDLYSNIKSGDGHAYALPQYVESLTNALPGRMWVYQPWLDAVGMKAEDIVTTEDFYNMLNAFKTKDPNGNGKADEIPALSVSIDKTTGETGGALFDALMSAFVRSTSGRSYLNADNGKLSVAYSQEEWKEGVKYIKSLIDAGLYDPSSLTMSVDSFKTVMNSEGDQLVGCFGSLSPSFVQKTHSSFGKWTLISPLTGPDGTCTTPYATEGPINFGFITKNCEYPELAFRMLDLLGREDFTISSRWGIQGEQWDYVENLKNHSNYKDVVFDETFAGYPAYIHSYATRWSVPQNDHWHNNNPAFRTAEIACGYYAASLEFADETDSNFQIGARLADYEAASPEEKIPKIKYPVETLAEATELENAIKGYKQEKLAQWLTGASDVEKDWAEYLAKLEKLGLSRFLELTQEAYDKMK